MQQFRNVPRAIHQAREAEMEEEIIQLLRDRPGMHGRTIWETIGNGRSLTFVTHAIQRLEFRKRLEKRGNGTRNNLYRYYLKDSSCNS